MFLLGAVLCLASGQRYYGSDQTEIYGNSAVPYVYRYRQRGPLSKRNVNEFQSSDYFDNVRRRRSIIPDLLQRQVVVKRAAGRIEGNSRTQQSCTTVTGSGGVKLLKCFQHHSGIGASLPDYPLNMSRKWCKAAKTTVIKLLPISKATLKNRLPLFAAKRLDFLMI